MRLQVRAVAGWNFLSAGLGYLSGCFIPRRATADKNERGRAQKAKCMGFHGFICVISF
jgi:hypothetical protein